MLTRTLLQKICTGAANSSNLLILSFLVNILIDSLDYWDEPALLDEMKDKKESTYKDILEKIKFEDEHTDHTMAAITPD